MDTSLKFKFQDNINNKWENAPEIIKQNIKCLPLIFYHDYDKYKYLEYSNKLLAPKSMLYGLSHYNNLIYPVSLKINNSDYIFTISEFIEDIDHLYIPNNIYNSLNLNNIEQHEEIEIINKNFDKGTEIILKPYESKFFKLHNPKVYLETYLKRQYSILHKNQTITFPYYENLLSFDVIDCKPSDIISIIDTDLEVDFEVPYDYIEPPSFSIKEDIENNHKSDSEDRDNEPEEKEFVPYSGKGYRLGSK